MTLADILKAELDAQGKSLGALATAAKLHKSRVHAVLTGVNENPGLLTVEAILAGLGKSLEWLARRRTR